MKQIIIKKLSMTNFKGMRNFTASFNDTVTTVAGCNGLGKTTIFDAFTWLLFGKDSKERKAFDIKTYDKDGKTIERIPHEVSGTLLVDGEKITLCRKLNEKWIKKRGTSGEVFTGNEEERLYNDVPMSLKDWNEKINAICPERVFKFITNPLYFTAQKADVQRAMLFRMAGDVSDADIAKGNKDFETLLASLTGKTMEEYKREIAAKKRRLKAGIEAIPERIDERKRDMPAAEDWDALESEMQAKKQELADTEAQIADAVKAYNARQDARLEKSKELADLRSAMLECELDIKAAVQRDCKQEAAAQAELKAEVETLNAKKARLESIIKTDTGLAEACRKKREELIAEWREINAETLKFNENDFVCPTCHRRFEIDEIEQKQAEITERFNTRKAERIADNNTRGKANKAKMDGYNGEIAECKDNIGKIDAKIAEHKANPLLTKEIIMPDAKDIIEADAEYQKMVAKAKKLTAEINSGIEKADTGGLDARKRTIAGEVDSIKERIGKRAYIEKNNTRIAELETELRNQSEELARLEGIEFTMQQFSKARVGAIESRINGMFTTVRFKMFDTQINGGEVETCEAVVDGVPYSVLNHAAQINAGIDIINAICGSEGICAPIFIDNAEAVNKLLATPSQLIRLIVTEDKELVIK